MQPPVSEIASTFFGGVGIGKIPHFSVCSSMIYLGTGARWFISCCSFVERGVSAVCAASDLRQIYELALISQLFPWKRLA